jgi:hypothetical protein
VVFLTFETDSQLVVQTIKGSEQDLARNGAMFREIKFPISLNFSVLGISLNQVADAMLWRPRTQETVGM